MRGTRFGVSAAILILTLTAGADAFAQERLGVGFDLWAETGQLSGEQWINASRLDESFDTAAAGGSISAWMLFLARDRVRAGPGIRFFGNYGRGGNQEYLLGFLTEAFMMGEYSLRAFEKFDILLGGRAGLAVLAPGGEFGEEITRLQREGVGVWSVPRPGVLAGIDVGLRRQLTGKFALRADLNAQYEQLFLFATNEEIDHYRFQKNWSTHTIRLGLLFGAEVSF
ncbi:MAG: hypothetical protein IRZ16_15680 [Myxococcaceae bacterium]|nr:hypothetical protein [Myxococcaceae bacterium]